MPRISDSVTDVAIYLYQTTQDAEAGSDIGGSGFIISLPVEGVPGRSWLLAVTNRHVIEQGNWCIRVNNKAGATSVFEVPEPSWVFHPDGQDLAVGPIPVSDDFHRFRHVGDGMFLSKERMAEIDLGLGTDTFMVGRFIGRDGGQTNIPTARFGHVAQMPTMIKNEYGQLQESFLVETRSIGGYSGSPVFAYKTPYQVKWGENAHETDYSWWGPILLGVDWGHSGQTECVFDASGRELEQYVESNTGLSLVIPAWRLRELLECDAFKERVRQSQPHVGDVDLHLPPELRPTWGG